MVNDLQSIANKIQTKYGATIKVAYIKKLPNGKYRVFSEKGKNLGTYRSKNKAKHRLKQIEYFKYLDRHEADDNNFDLDLSDMDNLSYSAIMRQLRQRGEDESITSFLYIFKHLFDACVLAGNIENVSEKILPMAISIFSIKHKTDFYND